MGVSKNRGTPKRMVYNGNPFKMDDLGKTPYFWKHPDTCSCTLFIPRYSFRWPRTMEMSSSRRRASRGVVFWVAMAQGIPQVHHTGWERYINPLFCYGPFKKQFFALLWWTVPRSRTLKSHKTCEFSWGVHMGVKVEARTLEWGPRHKQLVGDPTWRIIPVSK